MALAAGILLVEGLRLRVNVGALATESYLQAKQVRFAQVGGGRDLHFFADRLDLAFSQGQASEVVGKLSAVNGEQDFTADRLLLDGDHSAIKLSGQVQLWQGNSHFSLGQATLHADGSLTGTEVTLTDEQGTYTADAIQVSPDSGIEFTGNVRIKGIL